MYGCSVNCYSLCCISQPALNSSEAAIWHFCTLTSLHLCFCFFFRNMKLPFCSSRLCIWAQQAQAPKVQMSVNLWKVTFLPSFAAQTVSFLPRSMYFMLSLTSPLWEIVLLLGECPVEFSPNNRHLKPWCCQGNAALSFVTEVNCIQTIQELYCHLEGKLGATTACNPAQKQTLELCDIQIRHNYSQQQQSLRCWSVRGFKPTQTGTPVCFHLFCPFCL